jgi:hypothetical protein
MHMPRIQRHLLAAALFAAPLIAQQPRPPYDHERDAPVASAVRTAAPIRIDGVLDEAAWRTAQPISELRQLDPAEGQAVSERTEIRVLFDNEALYVGAWLYDRSAPRARLGRRDMTMAASDWLTLIFDSQHDHRTAFGFEINPAGVRRDQTRSPNNEDDSWEPVWEGATIVTDSGWFAEIRIPFSQLRFSGAATQTWGLQVERQIARNQEFALWPFTPRDQPSGIPRFGHLTGISNMVTGKRLEVMPYVVTRAEHIDRGGNPFRKDREYNADAGVDLKFRLTGNMTLDATVNPDFGQVEVDPAVINLTAFETFFPEKRPFFIEGSELFQFAGDGTNSMFYSRRIGRQPSLQPPYAARDVPDATRILGAAKLTGRTAGGWALGALDAVTNREIARFQPSTGVNDRLVAEPLTNYFVGRARREARAGQTATGAFIGAVNRDLETAELAGVLRSAAYTGGVDFSHQWDERTWTLNAFVAGSHVRGDTAVIRATQQLPYHYFQRPDADHIEVDPVAKTLTGFATSVQVSKRVGRHWFGNASLSTINPNYEVSDLGFQRRADRIDAQTVLEYSESRPSKVLRRWNAYLVPLMEHNYDGDNISNRIFSGFSTQFLNYWTANMESSLSPWPTIDDRLTRGGPAAIRPTNSFGFLRVGTDPRAALVGSLGGGIERGDALHSDFVNGSLTIKPRPEWEVRLSPAFNWDDITAQFIQQVPDPAATRTFGTRYVFADLRQTVFSLETRVNYTFTPALSLQAYVQPFVASGKFGAPKELAAPRTFGFLVYGSDIGEIANDRIYPTGQAGGGVSFPVPHEDFNVRSLRGNAVLRWEWRPGSTVYLAWQQTREDFVPIGNFDLGNDLRALYAQSPDNVVLLKITYWLNP